MFDIDEYNQICKNHKERINDLGKSLDIKNIEEELTKLEEDTKKENFWNDSKDSSDILSKISRLKEIYSSFKNLKNSIEAVDELITLLHNEDDEELAKDIKDTIKYNEDKLSSFEVKTLLSDKYDKNNAIVTIHPGAGGTEAMDWAQMLYRMYIRWAQDNNFTLEELDHLDGEEAGLKSVSFLASGEFAYGYLKSEHGVHRLVRISPFDAGGRRHTSFASVEVLPEISNDEKIKINEADIKMDVYRASGAGGQHINKTSSAVRLTHIPTGIVVSCQTQRSFFQNREYALKMLTSKLIKLKEQQNMERIEDLKGNQMDIAWGSQIRSYVFCPYTLVKDHRTNFETGNVQKVMDGDINDFINAYLKFNRQLEK